MNYVCLLLQWWPYGELVIVLRSVPASPETAASSSLGITAPRRDYLTVKIPVDADHLCQQTDAFGRYMLKQTASHMPPGSELLQTGQIFTVLTSLVSSVRNSSSTPVSVACSTPSTIA